MKTSSTRKKPKSLNDVLADVETGMAELVAAIAVEHKLALASRRRNARQHRHEPAHAA